MATLKKALQQLTLAAAVSAVAGAAIAATNPAAPTLGSSQGDFDVTLNKQDLIIINNFRDMVLAEFIDSPSGDYLGSQNLCVGRAGATSGTAASYAITASNSGSGFALTNGGGPGPGNAIAYQVYFNNEVQGVQEFAGKPELEHSVQNVSFDTNLNETQCTGGTTNSTIWVKALGTDIQAANPGVFTDTVTVTVAVN